jgi:hypothetical protein
MCGLVGVVAGLPVAAQLSCASTGSPGTTPAKPHPYSNTQQSKNNTANAIVQQHSHKLLKMDKLMPETY